MKVGNGVKIQIDRLPNHGPKVSFRRVGRRGKPRIYGPFSAIVRGRNARGEPFETGTFIENLSASGLFLRIPQRIKSGTKLFIVTRLAIAADESVPAPCIAIRAVGVRIQPQADDMTAVAAKIMHHRFLWPED